MEGKELQHHFHEHPLVLKVEQAKYNGGNDHPEVETNCNGCSIPISGPFYSCRECSYFLHKVCAELPSSLDHLLHIQHPLTLLERPPYANGRYKCNLCRENGSKFVYHCSICRYDVDMKCASATHVIHDKCHPHPLTTVQVPVAFPCHICLKKEEGLSYKCNSCPFWVHQNCILILDAVKHSDHSHLLKLLPSVPSVHCQKCDICHSKLFTFQSNYSCVDCLFFSHVSCARSEMIPSALRDENSDGQTAILLPMKQDSTDLISRFVRNYIDGDANIYNPVNHFDHEHPLLLINEKTTDKTCEACAIRISDPSYGCVDCDYFLHKCCTDLPKQIQHPLHPEHQLILRCKPGIFRCKFCHQLCNSSYYECSEYKGFLIDIKCASLQGTVYHEAHKHPLIPIINLASTCSACSFSRESSSLATGYILQCNTCSFELCFKCAMAPCVINHRYGKSDPFKLTYSAPQNHYDEYICEICLKELKPKYWYYHCVFGDQFAHISCMLDLGFDSNIKYGKSYMNRKLHEHELTIIRCTYDCSLCTRCRHPMRTGSSSVGLACKTCNFRRHLFC